MPWLDFQRLPHSQRQVSSTTELEKALLVTEIGVARDEKTIDALFGRMRALTLQCR